jgi:hypothetical protein
MYWRYFLWNFVGRQNDIQNNYGEKEYGNWITGIPVLDNLRLGNQSKLPETLKENKGRNVFFALPLILGITLLLRGGDMKKFFAGSLRTTNSLNVNIMVFFFG